MRQIADNRVAHEPFCRRHALQAAGCGRGTGVARQPQGSANRRHNPLSGRTPKLDYKMARSGFEALGLSRGSETTDHAQLSHCRHPGRRHRHRGDRRRRRGARAPAPSATAASRSTFDHFDWGSERYKKTGAFMPRRRPRPDQGPRRDLVRLGRRARRARPHHAVGPAARHLPAVRPVRQRAPDAHPAGHHQPAARRDRARSSTG